MSVNLVTWGGQLVTPRDDALVYEVAVWESGIIYGADITIKNSNTLHIAGGHGIICGRKFTIEEQDVSVVLPSAGTQNGRLYLHLDLSNTTEPISFQTEIAATLTPEVQDENVNITMGVYDVNLVTFTASTTAISDLVSVAPVVDPVKKMIASIAELKTSMAESLCHVAFRGKNLGSSLTAAQAAAIAAGDFSDLWNGDYWEINGHRWRIVDNTGYFKGRGVSETKNHLVIMPDDCLLKSNNTNKYMKDTNSTEGGYKNTNFRNIYREQCKSQFVAAFGGQHIVNHYGYVSSNVTNGHASNWASEFTYVDLPSEASIYGTIVWGDGYGQGYNTGYLHKQFALFNITPEFLIAKTMAGAIESYWLRDVVSASSFAVCQGSASFLNASNTSPGLRPYAILA